MSDHKEDLSDYHVYRKLRQQCLKEKASSSARFESIASRNNSSGLSDDLVKKVEAGKFSTDWRGVGMCKDPFDIILYQAMIWDNRPATIIEIGTLEGGTAMWFADIAKLFDISCQVYSLDIDQSLIHPSAKNRDDIAFLQGDCNHIEKTFTPEMLKSLPHPWMIIEDAHVNLMNVLEYFYKFMTSGDYVIIEDTHPGLCETVTDHFEDATENSPKKWGTGKLDTTRAFVERHPNELKIDTFYSDRFGYNGTWNVNGYIRRM